MNKHQGTVLNRRIESAINRVRNAVPGLVAFYRFGSQVQKTARVESDVDLALLGPDALLPEALLDLRQNLAMILHRDVDLVDLRIASTVLQMQVLTTGECLFSGDTRSREQFETLVYSSYARLNEERRGILEDIRSRGSVYAG